MNQLAIAAPRVAIIGGGFSGTMTAVYLAAASEGPLDIAVVEPRPTLGGGVAYSAVDPVHRINVPASRMTVYPDDPEHFDRWLRDQGLPERDPTAYWQDGSAYPPRREFGRYIAGLAEAASKAKPGIAIRHIPATATAVLAERDGWRVRLDSGDGLPANIVILAVSHPPPSVPAALRPALEAGAPIIANPWAPGALDMIVPTARILIIGTGLSMADAVCTLHRRNHRGPIAAISRRGLLSRGYFFGPSRTRNHFDTCAPATRALALARQVRAEIRAAAAEGEPWQAVFDDIRANARRLWAALDTTERRRLVRHLRPFWDAHRFRVAPQVEHTIATLRASGQLTVHAAGIRSAVWDGQSIRVVLQPRQAPRDAAYAVNADYVVVTTGPAHGSAIGANPALASLAEAGHVRPDPIGLGLDVDAANHARGAGGISASSLLVAGPLARGQVGELMGLPQVSEQASAVAREALGLLPSLAPIAFQTPAVD